MMILNLPQREGAAVPTKARMVASQSTNALLNDVFAGSGSQSDEGMDGSSQESYDPSAEGKMGGSGSNTPPLMWGQATSAAATSAWANYQGSSTQRPAVFTNGPASPVQHVANTKNLTSSRSEDPTTASLQPRLLKQINGLHTKEDLLAFVSTCIRLLDDINLVTCVYRLARMYGFVKSGPQRRQFCSDLQNDFSFHLLLTTIQSKMLASQLRIVSGEDIKGLDSRCVSNLVWAVVKLEVALEPGCVGCELIRNVSPLVVRFLSFPPLRA